MKIYCPYENVSCLLFVAFWWKEVVFFSSFRQFKPIAVPRPVVLSTGSNALHPYYDWAVACSMQRATLGVIYTSGKIVIAMQPYCIATAVKIFHSWSTVATAAQLAVHKDSSGFEGNLIRQRHSRRFCLKTCSCRLTMKPSRGECQALRARPEREVCNPQIHLHLPQHLSHLEARKTDNDNAKQQKRKIEDNSNCSQPLACAQASHPVSQTGGLSAHPDGTIAVLDQTSAIFPLHNRAAGRGPYISYGRNLQTCLNRPEKLIFSLLIWNRQLKFMLQHPTVTVVRKKQSKSPSKELLLYEFLDKKSTDVWKTVTNSACRPLYQ